MNFPDLMAMLEEHVSVSIEVLNSYELQKGMEQLTTSQTTIIGSYAREVMQFNPVHDNLLPTWAKDYVLFKIRMNRMIAALTDGSFSKKEFKQVQARIDELLAGLRREQFFKEHLFFFYQSSLKVLHGLADR